MGRVPRRVTLLHKTLHTDPFYLYLGPRENGLVYVPPSRLLGDVMQGRIMGMSSDRFGFCVTGPTFLSARRRPLP